MVKPRKTNFSGGRILSKKSRSSRLPWRRRLFSSVRGGVGPTGTTSTNRRSNCALKWRSSPVSGSATEDERVVEVQLDGEDARQHERVGAKEPHGIEGRRLD